MEVQEWQLFVKPPAVGGSASARCPLQCNARQRMRTRMVRHIVPSEPEKLRFLE